MTGWRQIGTAPRDGRTVLFYLPAGPGGAVRKDEVAIFWDGGRRSSGGWAGRGNRILANG